MKTEPGASERSLAAIVWAEQGCGYVLVADQEAFTPGLTTGAGQLGGDLL